MQKVPWSCLTDPYLALISLLAEASFFPLYSASGRKSVKESLFLLSADYQVKRSLLARKHWLHPRAEPWINLISPSSGDILWVWPIMNVHVPEPVLNHINCKNLHKNYCIHCWVGHHWRRPRQGSKMFIASWSITAELHPCQFSPSSRFRRDSPSTRSVHQLSSLPILTCLDT